LLKGMNGIFVLLQFVKCHSLLDDVLDRLPFQRTAQYDQ
jgi:hypothetical protein